VGNSSTCRPTGAATRGSCCSAFAAMALGMGEVNPKRHYRWCQCWAMATSAGPTPDAHCRRAQPGSPGQRSERRWTRRWPRSASLGFLEKHAQQGGGVDHARRQGVRSAQARRTGPATLRTQRRPPHNL
jgi:hypothetical protein